MPSRRRRSEPDKKRRKPATTLEGREQQLTSSAIDLAEQQIIDGTASSQVITHFLKLGSTRELLEQQRLQYENELTLQKIESLKAAERTEELYAKALQAMGIYSGEIPVDDVVEGED